MTAATDLPPPQMAQAGKLTPCSHCYPGYIFELLPPHPWDAPQFLAGSVLVGAVIALAVVARRRLGRRRSLTQRPISPKSRRFRR